MTTITSPWPFAQQGIDIVGPLSQGKKQVKFLLVAIDYFTKMVEAEALTTITKAKVQNFVLKNIICRFSIPRAIISDNDSQFNSQGFRSFCLGLGIINQFSSPRHHQANGQTEVTNRTLLKSIKVRLEGKGYMVGGTTKRPVGLPNHSQNLNRRDTVQPYLWH